MICDRPLTSAWIPSIIDPFPCFPTASFKRESMANVFSGYSLGKITVARKEVVPCFGKTPWVCSDKRGWCIHLSGKKYALWRARHNTNKLIISTWVQPEIQYITTATCNHAVYVCAWCMMGQPRVINTWLIVLLTHSMSVQVDEAWYQQVGGQALQIRASLRCRRCWRDSCYCTVSDGDIEWALLVLASRQHYPFTFHLHCVKRGCGSIGR